MYQEDNHMTLDDLVILNLPDCGSLIDAETLFLSMKASGITISIGSVYLKLRKLANLGKIQKIIGPDRKFLYGLLPKRK